MSSKSDGKSKQLRYSSMQQPPLIKQLRGILSEYPDGGQIIKELVQNAEDAGAQTMKILYDCRRINHDEEVTTKTSCKQFFQGPALCVYNNAEFQEPDWVGIRMISSSVKEEDRLKVGRFGLGFKSVFHITDSPCVLSGSQLLLINPQQEQEKVNAMTDLKDIGETECIDMNDFLNAFEGIFGFDKNCLENNHFPGTIFRFPLREISSDISDTLYSEEKVMDLFEGFINEASTILIFLKSLEKVSLHIRTADNVYTEKATVEITDADGSVKEKRQRLKETLRNTSLDCCYNDIASVCIMEICTSCAQLPKDIQQWMVVNYLVGKSASNSFRKLIKDPKLGYSPLVGVAAPLMLSNSEYFEGHVFCFLPLPKEGVKLTGLPVHVNGFFALNQSRHHLKRPTKEQKKSKIDDKSILWNQLLTEEALPEAYRILIKSLIAWSSKSKNTSKHIKTVYNAMPRKEEVIQEWKILENNLYTKLKTEAILFSDYGRQWIVPTEACFATFQNLTKDLHYNTHVKKAVRKYLATTNQKYVSAPKGFFDTLTAHFGTLEDMSPKTLSQFLSKHKEYKEMTRDEKLCILEYLLLDGKNYQKVEGLQLLPLDSGEFAAFCRHSPKVFFCTEEEMILFRGLESRFLWKESYKRKPLVDHLSKICEKDFFQLSKVDPPTMKSLLQETVDTLMPRETVDYMLRWLEDVWKTILQRFHLKDFTDVPIVPIATKGNWPKPTQIALVKLNDLLLLKSLDSQCVPKCVCTGLSILNVKILSGLPKWIPKKDVDEYICLPTPGSVMKLLSKVRSQTNLTDLVANFNQQFTAERNEFLSYFADSKHLDKNAKEVLQLLQLFHVTTSRQDQGKYCTLTTAFCFMTAADVNKFHNSLTFPLPILTVKFGGERFLLNLGIKKMALNECVKLKIQQLIGKQNIAETSKFMSYFIENFHLFVEYKDIIAEASTLPFLNVGDHYCKASEVFDPSDERLASLLVDESLLPDESNALNTNSIHVLKCLGMKGIKDITVPCLYQIAKTLHGVSISKTWNDKVSKKAEAFFDYIKRDPDCLNKFCIGKQSLKDSLLELSCIPYKVSFDGYPDCIPWFKSAEPLCKPGDAKDVSFCHSVGGIIPVVENSSKVVSDIFSWNVMPPLKNIMQQLELLQKNYSDIRKPGILTLTQAIYDHLNNRLDDLEKWVMVHDSNTKFIWNGDGFIAGNRMVIHCRMDDLDLKPYIYTMPSEFSNKPTLFKAFGCTENQDCAVLMKALALIKEQKSLESSDVNIVGRDKNIVIAVLNRLAQIVTEQNVCMDETKLLMLVNENKSKALTLVPVSECTYDDDPEFSDDHEGSGSQTYFVDEHISLSTAKTLGVKSIKTHSLLDAKGLGYEECGQTESLTSRINALLREGYTDGFTVPKELVQNADDAGATIVKFLYDERSNLNAERRLLSQGLKDCQGPALWVFNDANFTEADFENITKLNGATKEQDFKKIGKFGLGFCSVYNLTDVPSFVSGRNFVIFDPHGQNLEDVPNTNMSKGLKINLASRELIRRHSDQFRPYERIFECSILDPNKFEFKGTLFRLPLRTKKQAMASKILQKAYSKDDMFDLIRMIIGKAGNLLLFSQNVKQIEVHHLSEESESLQPQCLFTIEKESFLRQNNKFSPLLTNVLTRIPSPIPANLDILEIHKVTIAQHVYNASDVIRHSLPNVPELSRTTWLISWSSGLKRSLKLSRQLVKSKAIPLTAVAVPCLEDKLECPLALSKVNRGFYDKGHVFCFLPLPVETCLNFHVNGFFDVTSDRRQLFSLTEDDKRTGQKTWNEELLADSLVRSHLHLLKEFSEQQQKTNFEYIYHSLWPTECSAMFSPFRDMFFKALLHDNLPLFKETNTWITFDAVLFLDPIIRAHTTIGDIAFDFMCKFPPVADKYIVEIPEKVIQSLMECNPDFTLKIAKACLKEEDVVLQFLKHIQCPYWNTNEEKRNIMILHALSSKNELILSALRQTNCIPTEPNGKLCRPGELIDPNSELGNLFQISDGRFPQHKIEFQSTTTTLILVNLGMHNKYLPKDLLVERCRTIETVASACVVCAKTRMIAVMQYLSKTQVQEELRKDAELISQIQNTNVVPVKSRPSTWPFPWYAEKCSNVTKYGNRTCSSHQEYTLDTFCLSKPTNIYKENTADIIGAVQNVVDEEMFGTWSYCEASFKALGVKEEEHITQKEAILQLMTLAKACQCQEIQHQCVATIFTAIYTFLNKSLKYRPEQFAKDELAVFTNIPVVLIDKELVKPCHVAIRVKYECPPHLYQLPRPEFEKKLVYTAFGVQEYFTLENVISALQSKKEQWTSSACNEIENISNMLKVLQDCMHREKKTYADLTEHRDSIVAPDINGFLWPTHQLANEDTAFISKSNMKILHKSVAPDIANELGVKSKKRKIVEGFSSLIPFGQKEKLVTRLTGLLKDYPCDACIMKELLQNADDANATEIHFIKDFRTHTSTRHTFGSEKLQGPALCIFNDSFFTEKDFEGIHYLGEGSKRGDPTKTGQYGVGFNAVYHLTDAPSFLTIGPGLGTEGQLCIFDPLQQYIQDFTTETDPGIKCNVKEMKEHFPDLMNGYLQDTGIFCSGQGTLFRLPLRQEKSELGSSLISTADLENIVNSFKDDMFDVLMFVKNVSAIKVSKVVGNNIIEEYAVRAYLSEEDQGKRSDFFKHVKSMLKSKSKREPIEVGYTLKLEDNEGKCSEFYIVQRYGLHAEVIPEKIRFAINEGELNQMFIGGVAVPLIQVDVNLLGNQTQSCDSQSEGVDANCQSHCKEEPHNSEIHEKNSSRSFIGKAFCFLPLPGATGLPIHVNGHFNLDHARRALWKEGVRQAWNDLVMTEIVAHAWVSSIKYLRDYIFDRNMRWTGIKELTNCYYRCFPSLPISNDEIKVLIKAFYTHALQNSEYIFPVIVYLRSRMPTKDRKISQESAAKQFNVEWVPLTTSKTLLRGVFNDIYKHTEATRRVERREFSHDDHRNEHIMIETTLKRMGFKIIQSQKVIQHTIKELEIEVFTASPALTAHFLKSWNSESEFKCNIGNVNVSLETTTIADMNSLLSLLKYITFDDDFPSNLAGLPLCLTNDNILRIFSADSPFFCSRFASLLPNSASLFVHTSFVDTIGNKPCNVLKTFRVEDMLELLPESYAETTFAQGKHLVWNKDRGIPIKHMHVFQFFQFLFENAYETNKYGASSVNLDKFFQYANMFKKWAMMPSYHRTMDTTHFELVPIEQSFHLFCRRFLHPQQEEILKKLNMPMLDEHVFKDYPEIISAVSSLLASTTKTVAFLNCLHYYREQISSSALQCHEGITLLSYFETRIKELKDEHKSLLLALPLFPTQQNSLVSIRDVNNVITLPSGMPTAGVETWAYKTGIILLKKTDHLEKLYEFLGFPGVKIIDVYIQKILPNVADLPKDAWITHVEFIKDILFRPDLLKNNDAVQLQLVGILKRIAFVDKGGKYKRVDSFYCENNTVFKCMLDESHFLPERFRHNNWRNLLEALGLNVCVTDQLMIQYVNEIEDEGRHVVSAETTAKSQALTNELFSREWQGTTLAAIKLKRFVKPYTVDKMCQNVFQQLDGDRFIYTNDSVLCNHQKVCWTSCHILERAPSKKQTSEMLGILKEPTFDKLVLHAQNVCDAFEKRLQNANIDTEFVKQIMEQIYTYLQRHISEKSVLEQRLQHTPFVYIPEHSQLVRAKNVVLTLAADAEVIPYLFTAPLYFGKFFDLFEIIGCKKAVTASHYAAVLEVMKRKFNDDELPPNALGHVTVCLKNMDTLLKGSDMSLTSVHVLYLPDRRKVLSLSTNIVVSNNEEMERRISQTEGINYFIGFKEIEVRTVSDPTKFVKKLPTNLQPKVLTELVLEEVSLEHLCIVESIHAVRIEAFLRCSDFLQGILRLVKHQMEKDGDEFTHVIEARISQNIRSVEVKKVNGLQTYLLIDGNIIEGSEREKTCFIEANKDEAKNEACTLYFQTEESNEKEILSAIMQEDNGLIDLIDKCTGQMLCKETYKYLSQLLNCIDQPELIQTKLDKLKIQAYDLPYTFLNSVFPKSGTYVDRKFYPFLEQGITPFQQHEFRFIAFELEDEIDNASGRDEEIEPLYIYAHIIREIERERPDDSILKIRYLIDIGERGGDVPVIVPLTRIYRFVRKDSNTGDSLIKYDDEHVGSLPFDENCRRVRNMLKEAWSLDVTERKRIIRRLLMKWHPDKNIGNEEYATRVFNYMQEIIMQLENGEVIETVVNNQTGRSSPDLSRSSYCHMSSNLRSRGRRYARAFRENVDEYNRSQKTGSYSHINKAVMRDIHEAKRWLKQARNDFKAAEASFPSAREIDAHNWVCFQCQHSAEKALKAACFAKDANKVEPTNHSLPSIARNLCDTNIAREATCLQTLLVSYERMTYPNAVDRHFVPPDLYRKDHAEKALEISRRILVLVSDFIDAN